MTEYRFTFTNGTDSIIKTACSEKIALFLLECTNRDNYTDYKLVDKKPVIKKFGGIR